MKLRSRHTEVRWGLLSDVIVAACVLSLEAGVRLRFASLFDCCGDGTIKQQTWLQGK